jgi:hypothetical protein
MSAWRRTGTTLLCCLALPLLLADSSALGAPPSTAAPRRTPVKTPTQKTNKKQPVKKLGKKPTTTNHKKHHRHRKHHKHTGGSSGTVSLSKLLNDIAALDREVNNLRRRLR